MGGGEACFNLTVFKLLVLKDVILTIYDLFKRDLYLIEYAEYMCFESNFFLP